MASLKGMTLEEKKARKRKQKNEAQKRYYQKHKEYYKTYSREHNYYKERNDKAIILIDKMITEWKLNNYISNFEPKILEIFSALIGGNNGKTNKNKIHK